MKTKYFCPACLAELEWDYEWDDHPTFKCPKCGERCQDQKEIEANPLKPEDIIKLRKKFIASVKWLWDNPSGHIYIPFHNDVIHPLQYSRGPWITGEMGGDEDGEYICAYLTTKVDTFGEAYGDILADAYINKGDDEKVVGEYFDHLTAGLDMYGSLEGKLVSAPTQI